MSSRLLLFDIDGTLVDTGGAGLTALLDATREVFGDDGPALDLAGATDNGLLKNIFKAFGREEDEVTTAAFFDSYHARLEANLLNDCFGSRVLPGAMELLKELTEAGEAIGLLTGNTAAGAEVKMQHHGMEGFFPFGAYGDDHFDRNKLGPIALARAEREFSKSFSPENTIVIGDTPKDIKCAQALGARSVCVATGSFTVEQLGTEGADTVFEDFSDVEAVLAELLR